jgi:hypothetical protein
MLEQVIKANMDEELPLRRILQGLGKDFGLVIFARVEVVPPVVLHEMEALIEGVSKDPGEPRVHCVVASRIGWISPPVNRATGLEQALGCVPTETVSGEDGQCPPDQLAMFRDVVSLHDENEAMGSSDLVERVLPGPRNDGSQLPR